MQMRSSNMWSALVAVAAAAQSKAFPPDRELSPKCHSGLAIDSLLNPLQLGRGHFLESEYFHVFHDRISRSSRFTSAELAINADPLLQDKVNADISDEILISLEIFISLR